MSAIPTQSGTAVREVSRGLSRGTIPLILLLFVSPLLLEAQTLPDRGAPPKLGPPPELHLPSIQHLKLSNGLPVILLEKHGVPLVQVNLLVMSGEVEDPPGKRGLASMTAAMMTEGAGTRNALEFADAIDFLGARLSVVSGFHTSAVELHTPLAKLDSALGLMADVALRPLFSGEELERMRKERLTELLQWRDDPPTLASVAFNRALYGKTHPYGEPLMGDEASLRTLQAPDLRSFHDRSFTPDNATVIVVGDVTSSTILPRLERAFGSWQSSPAARGALQNVEQVRSTRVILVDKPGAAQTQIRIGRIGAERLTDDYYAIVVMNTILGGSFTSRLNQNLREEHGYTYGAGSRFDFRMTPGPFAAGAAVQTDVTDKALGEFMKELRNIVAPVTEPEVDRARNYVALSFPRDFESVDQVASQLEQLVIYRLPDDYFDRYVGRILAVTAKDVQRVATKYIDPAKMLIVLVGDRAKIEKGVEALNLGPLTLMSIEDVLGKPPQLGSESDKSGKP